MVACRVFSPVVVSQAMCARLDALDSLPAVSSVWLTSWSADIPRMDPFPGSSWAPVPAASARSGRRWWKLVALEAWLQRHPTIPLCNLAR